MRKSSGLGVIAAGACLAALGLAGCEGGPDASSPEAQAAKPWVKKLQTGSASDRDAAVRELAKLPSNYAADALLTAAHGDVRIQVRTVALAAIAQHGKLAEAYVPRLTALLGDKDDAVRRQTCETLGVLKIPSTVDALLGCLSDKSAAVRTSALGALSRMGPAALEKLAAAFATGSTEQRAAIADAFADAQDKSRVPMLVEALKADDEYLRRTVASALGRLGDKQATAGLVALIVDPLPDSKEAEFGRNLQRGPREEDLNRIADALNRDQVNAGTRGRVEASQLKVRDGHVQAKYRQLVAADRANVSQMIRVSAMEALRSIDPDGGMDLITGYLASEDPAIADAARKLLAGLGEGYRKTLAQIVLDTSRPVAGRVRAAKMLAGKDDALTQGTFNTLLGDSNESLQLIAAAWFCSQKDGRAAGTLGALLKSPAEEVRRSAAQALTVLPSSAAADAVAAALPKERSPQVRRALIRLAGLTKAVSAQGYLVTIAQDPADPDRAEAIGAMGQIGDPAMAATLLGIYEGLSTKTDRGTVHATILALGEVRAQAAVPMLLKEVGADTRDRWRASAAMTALGDIGDKRATAVIAAALRKPIRLSKVGVNDEGNAGIDALAKLRDPASVEVLAYLVRIEDPSGNTNKRAAEVLAKMKLPKGEDLDALIGLLNDPGLSPAIKEAAVVPSLIAAGERAVPPLMRVLLGAPQAPTTAEFDAGFYAAQVLGYIGKPALEPLKRAGESEQAAYVYGRIVEALHPIDDDGAVEVLAGFLNSKNPLVRQWAAVALGKSVRSSAAIAVLEGRVGKDEEDVELKKSVQWAIDQQRKARTGP